MADMKLRECPFCGSEGKPHIQTAFPDNVICAKCGCASWLKLWNTRPTVSTIEAQEAEIKRLREALQFYASEESWKHPSIPENIYKEPGVYIHMYSKIDSDNGKIAQAALKKGE